jgi:hypothetical protein
LLARGGGIAGWLIAAPLNAALSRAGAWAVIVALAVLGLLGPTIVRGLDLGFLFPLALVAIGIAVLAGAVRPRRPGRSPGR